MHIPSKSPAHSAGKAGLSAWSPPFSSFFSVPDCGPIFDVVSGCTALGRDAQIRGLNGVQNWQNNCSKSHFGHSVVEAQFEIAVWAQFGAFGSPHVSENFFTCPSLFVLPGPTNAKIEPKMHAQIVKHATKHHPKPTSCLLSFRHEF